MRRLRANNNVFTVCELSKEEAENVRRSTSTVYQFAEDCLAVTGKPDDFTTESAIYREYCLRCSEEGITSGGRKRKGVLMEELETALPGVRRKQKGGDNNRMRGLSGISGIKPSRPGWPKEEDEQ